jgi:hypothetical protein
MISKRHKIAGIEQSQSGVGVSTSARIYARRFYGSQGNNIWATAPNDKVNDLLAQDFSSSSPMHRFKLKSGEIAEIRKSATFIYVAVMRHGSYDIIVLQKAYKEAKPEISKRRLESPEWSGKGA